MQFMPLSFVLCMSILSSPHRFLEDIQRGMADSWIAFHPVQGSCSSPDELLAATSAIGIASLQDFLWVQSLTELICKSQQPLCDNLSPEWVNRS